MARVYGSLYKKVAEIEEQVKRLVKAKDFHKFVVISDGKGGHGSKKETLYHYNTKTKKRGAKVNHKKINALPGVKVLLRVGCLYVPSKGSAVEVTSFMPEGIDHESFS